MIATFGVKLSIPFVTFHITSPSESIFERQVTWNIYRLVNTAAIFCSREKTKCLKRFKTCLY